MKKYKYLLFALGLSLSGCSIDREPLDQLSQNQFWQNQNDFDLAMTAIYGKLQTGMFSAGTPDWDLITDNAYGQHNSNSCRDILTGEISPSTGGFIPGVYSNAYSGIARVNIFLKQLETYNGNFLDKTTIDSYVGQAKFMRAYYYFMLYACYGDVPLVKEPLDLNNFIQPKVSAQEILEFVYEDLDNSINLLASTVYASGKGRVVKSSAQALKLRVLMYTGYNANGTANTAILSQARSLASEIMNSGYQLSPKFENIFRDSEQEGNPEIIFSVKFLAPNNYTSMDQWYGDWVGVSPLPNFIALFEQGDLRKDLSIFKDEVDFGTGKIHRPSNNMPTGYGMKKFLTPENIPYGYATRSAQDWVLLRYAEVLLNYAEAENEVSGPISGVYNAINAIRKRADLNELPLGLSKEQMREAIRKERRIELAFEGIRYFDLKRWHIAGQILNAVNDGIIKYRFEDKFYLWPLPQAQIDRSQGKLIQNKDYQ